MNGKIISAKGRAGTPICATITDAERKPLHETGTGRFHTRTETKGSICNVAFNWLVPNDERKTTVKEARFRESEKGAILPEFPVADMDAYAYRNGENIYVVRPATRPVVESLMKSGAHNGLAEVVGMYVDSEGYAYSCCKLPGGSMTLMDRIPGHMEKIDICNGNRAATLLGSAVRTVMDLNLKGFTFNGDLPRGALAISGDRITIGGLTNLRVLKDPKAGEAMVGDLVAVMRAFTGRVDYGTACAEIANYMGNDTLLGNTREWYRAKKGRAAKEDLDVMDLILEEAGLRF